MDTSLAPVYTAAYWYARGRSDAKGTLSPEDFAEEYKNNTQYSLREFYSKKEA